MGARFIILTYDASVVRDTETKHNYHTNSPEEAQRLADLLNGLIEDIKENL